MFNLIVAVISIALIAAMAAASIFYGGSAFSSGTAEAQATTLINNGQQISGAQQLHMIDNSGNRAENIEKLVTDNYLQAEPTPPSIAGGYSFLWNISDSGNLGLITFGDEDVAEKICDEVAAQGGFKDTDTFVGPNTNDISVASLVDGSGNAVQYGCVAVGFEISGITAKNVVFVHKL